MKCGQFAICDVIINVEKQMKKENCMIQSKLKEKLLHIVKKLKKLFSVNTMIGLFIVTFAATVAATFFTDSVKNADPNDTPTNDITIPDNTDIDSVTPSDADSSDSASDAVAITTEEPEKKISAIQKLSIGANKDWIEEELGTHSFTKTISTTEKGRIRYTNSDMIDEDGELICMDDITDNFSEYIYIIDDVIIVTIFFDESDYSCKAFFVTLLGDIQEIVMPDAYSSIISDKPLGEFTFMDINGEPERVSGHSTAGDGHTFYCEEYYYEGAGNYQNFYFAVLDYTIVNSRGEFNKDITAIQPEINPMRAFSDLSYSDSLTEIRDKYYPNTYGISSLNSRQTFSLIGGVYTDFDSSQLARPAQ